MTNETPSTPIKTFCVWADYVRRMYQHVEAEDPKSAVTIAEETGAWEPCEIHDHNSYRVSNEVQDLATEEFVAVDGQSHCKACGSEIVGAVDGSLFCDGECGSCEYRRCRSQPDLLRLAARFELACEERIGILEDERLEDYAWVEDIDDQLGRWKALQRK